MKEEFAKWIAVAKMAVYDKGRADQYLTLMQTRGGAVSAVMNMLSALEQKRPIPEAIKPMLAINVYLMMVDVAMNATGDQPSKEAMMQTIRSIMESVGSGAQAPAPEEMAPTQAAAQPAAPQGMLAMGGV